ncbi:Transient receptor potential cation channel subfamily A member 1 [Plecturocebus cupreus]
MKRSLKKMWRPGEKKEPQGVVYEDVPDDTDDCKDSLKVPWALAGRDRFRSRGGWGSARGFLAGSPWFGGSVEWRGAGCKLRGARTIQEETPLLTRPHSACFTYVVCLFARPNSCS